MAITQVMRAFGPGSIVKVADMNEDAVLLVRQCSVETGPFGPPEVHMECQVLTKTDDGDEKSIRRTPMHLRAKRVIYNPPATIVLWKDGTKTVVKCDPEDKYDMKYGLALCYMKKALGNTSRALNDVLHREVDKE